MLIVRNLEYNSMHDMHNCVSTPTLSAYVSFYSRRGAFIMDVPAQKTYVPLHDPTNQPTHSFTNSTLYHYMADIENGFCLLSFASEQ